MPSLRDDWSAALLVGGLGRRLGGIDKGTLLVGGRSILARQLDALAACGLPVALVTRSGDRSHANSSLATISDAWPGCGPLGGLHAALAHARTHGVVVLAADLPFVTAAFLDHLMAAATSDACVVPCTRGRLHPLCAAYPVSAAGLIHERLTQGRLAVRDLFDELPHRLLNDNDLAPFDPDGMLLFNVNTPDDLQHAQRYADQLGAHRTAASVDRQTPRPDLFV